MAYTVLVDPKGDTTQREFVETVETSNGADDLVTHITAHSPPDDKVMKQWRVENRQRMLETMRAWNKANRELRRKNDRVYRQKYPEKHCEKESRRRARKRNSPVGVVDYAAIWERDNGICHICGLAVKRSDLHYDHVIPLSKGGPHSQDNIHVSHSWCNIVKGNKLPS